MSERTYVLLGILCFIVGILTMAYITVSNMLAVEGVELSALDDQVHTLHNKNLGLEDEFLHEGSYTTIYQKATKAGFVQGSTVQIGY